MRPADAGGFTLVEVLVALAIAGLVSLLALHGVGFAAHGLDLLSQHAARLDQRRSLELLMRRGLATAVAKPVVAGEPGFVGAPASVSFLCLVDEGGPGLYRVTLSFDPSRSSAPLMMTRRLASRDTARSPDETVLMQRVRRFEIGYFGAAAPTDEPGWHRQWAGIARLPQLVRIRLESDGESRAPPIVIRLPHAG